MTKHLALMYRKTPTNQPINSMNLWNLPVDFEFEVAVAQ